MAVSSPLDEGPPAAGATPDLDVAVIGAGPHGLSATTHLRRAGVRGARVRRPDGLLESRCPRG